MFSFEKKCYTNAYMEVIMKEDFSIRLQKAMNIRNIKATELSEKAHIPKSAISQYLSGLYEAKQKSIFKLAKAFIISSKVRFSSTFNVSSLNSSKTLGSFE